MIRAYLFAMVILIFPMTMIAAPNWQIDPAKSSIKFTATQNNAPITGEFKKFSGEIAFDPSQLNTSHVQIVIDLGSVNASYNEVVNSLKSPDWFNVKMFPQATFTASSFVKTGDNSYVADGKLTIRDKTVPVKLAFALTEYSAAKAVMNGNVILKRTQFGVGQGEWADTGAIKDDVQVQIAVTAMKSPV